MHSLPHCDDLFLRFFDPWYGESDRERRAFSATYPDLLTDESFKGGDATEISCLKPELQHEVVDHIQRMLHAARGDWPHYLAVSGEPDLSWISAFDAYYTRLQIQALIERSDPSDFGNDYLIICCEFGAALGYVLQASMPRLAWIPDWPYWDSVLLDPKSGCTIAVFHWAIKKMSEYGVDDGFTEKVLCCVQYLTQADG